MNVREVYSQPGQPMDSLQLNQRYLKVHLKNGNVAIIRNWDIDNENEILSGVGYQYNPSRKKESYNPIKYELNFEDCVLIETNDYEGFNLISPLIMTFTTLTAAVTVPCIFDPKSCFGSCPTYYLYQGDSLVIQAEGFSSSITKSMESIDVDYLSAYVPSETNELRIELKNEALETHYIRRSELVALKRPADTEVFYGNGQFYSASGMSLPIDIVNTDGMLKTLKLRDGVEYFSKSDSADLTQKEAVIIEFDPHDGASTGVVITHRQSLMTTFLFYQSMAYMGSKIGELAAAYERMSPAMRSKGRGMNDLLGGIEVSVMIDGKWKYIGDIEEVGPITSDTHILPVNAKGEFTKVRLEMTKGLWRIDQVALFSIHDEVEPTVIQPSKLLRKGVEDADLLSILNDPEQMLVNNPGTSYTLVYELPKNNNLSLFLKSQGYYTEWMRKEWLKDESPEMARLFIKKPHKWLKLMTPKYKLVEAKMDSLFWSSKFGTLAN